MNKGQEYCFYFYSCFNGFKNFEFVVFLKMSYCVNKEQIKLYMIYVLVIKIYVYVYMNVCWGEGVGVVKIFCDNVIDIGNM